MIEKNRTIGSVGVLATGQQQSPNTGSIVGPSTGQNVGRTFGWRLNVAIACCLGLLAAGPVVAQERLVVPQGNQRILIDDVQVQRFAAVNGPAARPADLSEKFDDDSGQHAILKTDPDLESILEKAERFAKDENWAVATKLWQAVLDRSGDAMYSTDGELFYSLAEQVERTLALLPPDGLKAYRVRADAEAKAIIAASEIGQRSQGLGQVVGNYFVSSVGDDAAFQLGCLNLDRYDFVGALRLFQKVLKSHPDSDIPQDQLHLRIALCHAFLGNAESAQQSIQNAEQVLGGQPTTGSVPAAQLQAALTNLSIESVSAMSGRAIEMHLSGPRRYGVMPSLPKNALAQDLAAVWQFYVEPKPSYVAASANGRTLVGRRSHGDSAVGTRNSQEEQLIDAWRSKDWRPAGQVLVQDDRIYFKSAADIAVWDRQRIAEISFGATEQTVPSDWVSWRSVWRNAFKMDTATKMLQLMRRQYGNYRRNRGSKSADSPFPMTAPEIQFFGDRVYQEMSICGGVLYAIEGEAFDDRVRSSGRDRNTRVQYNASIRRTRQNQLTAYDSETGRLQWSLPVKTSDEQTVADVEDSDATPSDQPTWIEGGGFMAAPIEYGNLVLVPVNEGGAITVYALDPNEAGRTVWKAFLCDEPETGAVAWSPIHLSLDGSDLFVSTGLGAVFVLDATTGKIRFGKRYFRKGEPDRLIRGYNPRQARLRFDGWSSDMVVPWQNQLVCFASDTDTIFALDRTSGQLIWSCPMNPIGHRVDYLLGVQNNTLYAGGPTTIIAYDLRGEGRMVWGAEDLFDGKTASGRGMLTKDAIYIPVDNGIYQFSLAGKNGKAEVVAKAGVRLGTEAPVGNLFSDGQRIWVHGGNRLYALGPNLDK